MAHLRRGVQRSHAVLGAHVRVCAALLYQVLRHLQVALLARQVQGRGTVAGLGIYSPANRQHPPWVLDAHCALLKASSSLALKSGLERLCVSELSGSVLLCCPSESLSTFYLLLPTRLFYIVPKSTA